MIPPTSIDGTDITGATIDGTDVTEITVDGDVVFSAELSGFLLDDWSDNKLTNRDDFATTPLNPSTLEPSSSNFQNPTRPEWTTHQGSPSASNNQLELPDGQANTEAILSTPTNINEGTWEFDVQFTGSNTSAGSFQFWLTDNPGNPTGGTGYFFSIGTANGAGPMQLRYYINGSGQGNIINGDDFPSDNAFHTCRLEAFDDGAGGLDLEIFLDGVSGGTGNENVAIQSHTSIRGNADTQQNVDNFRVF